MSPKQYAHGALSPTAAKAYEPPTLTVLGSVRDLTEFCIFGKTIGQPDYFQHIPITNCSS